MSSTESFLREIFAPSLRDAFKPGPLMDLVAAEIAEKRRRDEEWLASLSARDRHAELMRRRIARCQDRLRAALDFSRCDCDRGY